LILLAPVKALVRKPAKEDNIQAMKLMLVVLSCVLALPFCGLAQAGPTPITVITPPPSGNEMPNAVEGLVTAVTGETITVKTGSANPLSFAVNKTVQYTDHKGRKVKPQRIKTGMRVRVYYQGTEDTRTATRIVLEG
jgi:hypothetical protein